MNRKYALIVLSAICILKDASAMAEQNQPVIDINFARGDKFDADFWGFEKGYVRGKELGYYVPEFGQTVTIKNRLLTIEARRYDPDKSQFNVDPNDKDPAGDPVQYVSGSIYTNHAWECAKFEVVARMPTGLGTFPAIWLRGIRQDTYGEIDIVEYVGRKANDLGSTIYFGTDLKHLDHVTKHISCDNCTDDFRTYTAELDGRTATVSIDGQQIIQKNYGKLLDAEKAPLAQPYRLKINLALGGPNAGPIDDRSLPARLQIRSVQIWEKTCLR